MSAALFELFFYGSWLVLLAAVLGTITFIEERKEKNAERGGKNVR